MTSPKQSIPTTQILVFLNTILYQKKPELLGEMGDSRVGTGKLQDKLKYLVPESKDMFKKMMWTC